MTKFVSKEIERELMSNTIFRALLIPVLFFNSQFTHTQPKSMHNINVDIYNSNSIL